MAWLVANIYYHEAFYAESGIMTLPNDAFSIAASMILFPLMIEVVQIIICFRAGSQVVSMAQT